MRWLTSAREVVFSKSDDAINLWERGDFKKEKRKTLDVAHKKLAGEGKGILTVYAKAHGDIYKATYKGSDQTQS